MGIHLDARVGEIAESILLPGDPLRAKFLAEKYFENSVCHNQTRGMLGYTGYVDGKMISVQGTGMGVPSISIYVTELIQTYGCKNLIRIGTCGAIQPELKLGDTILAITASTDSRINNLIFGGREYAPHADFELLKMAYDFGKALEYEVKVGSVFTTDSFFVDDLQKEYEIWRQHGVLGVEMETSALYTLAARYHCKALSILTVSDQLVTGERATAQERLTAFTGMMEIALACLKNL
ncbi:MAG TPA: purine-nucleoside phosphorylase [Bacteroidales bacterium]|nr:purine-nucleoside phosphorylase [Bacteroidales bacterium]